LSKFSSRIQAFKLVHKCIAILTGTDEKVEKCIKLGADIGINHNEEDFVQRTLEETNGDG
jgi:NADPH:quinone reductase-like Zn-dependent oxidoreductase